MSAPAISATNQFDPSPGMTSVASGPTPRRTLKRFGQHRLAVVAVLILGLLLVAVLCAPLSPYNSDRSNLPQRFQAPSMRHPFGTDDLVRDELTRTLAGGRISLAVGLLAMFLSF